MKTDENATEISKTGQENKCTVKILSLLISNYIYIYIS